MTAEIFKFINNQNPWAKARLDEFLQYVCPECDFKCFSKTVFSSHALDNHIDSRECLELKIKAEMDVGLEDVTVICAFEVTEKESSLETTDKDKDVEVIEEVTEKKTETEKEDKKKDNEDEPSEVEPMEDHDYTAFDDSEVAEEVVEHKVEFIEHSIESSNDEPVVIATPKKEISENVPEKREEFQASLSDSVTKKSNSTPISADEENDWGIRREFIDKDSTTCHICDKKFSNRKGMTDHLRKIHKVYSANGSEKLRMATTCTRDETGQKNFECSICDATFPSRYRMYRHLRDDHGESMLFTTDPIPPSMYGTESPSPENCPECNKEFRNRKNMMEHLRNVHGIYATGPKPQPPQPIPSTPANCPVCDKEYPSEKRVKAHLRQVHMIYHGCTEEEIQLAKEEYTKLQQQQQLQQNHGSTPTTTITMTTRTRASDQPTICPVCDKEFGTPVNMKDHRRKIHNVYASASEEDIKLAKEQWMNQQQVKIPPTPQNRGPIFNQHQGGNRTPQKRSYGAVFGNFTCQVCDATFTLHAKLRLHLRNVHDIQMGESDHANKPLKERQQVFSCDFCHKKFALSKLLDNHIRDVHSGISVLDSPYGDKRIPMGGQQVIIIHSTKEFDSPATQLFQCEHCSATFRNQVDLNKHVNDQHTYVKCDFCYLTFESKWEKKKHMLIAHTQQRYQVEDDDKQCHVCQKNFQSKLTLKRHLKNIHRVEFL